MKSKSLFIILSLFLSSCFVGALGQVNLTECGMKMTDTRDGKTYSTVKIGTQCWMAENLNAGTKISLLKDQRDNGIIEKYCYDNNEANCSIYGGLYQWNEMMQFTTEAGTQGICPPTGGWHLPSDKEWCTLATFLDSTVNCNNYGPSGTNVNGKMKSTGTIEAGTGLWYYPNIGATNESGFAALPAGTRSIYSKFFYIGYHAYFWSSVEFSDTDAWFFYLKYSNNAIYRESYFKASGYSVRCIKDNQDR